MSNNPTRPVKAYENTEFLSGPDAPLLRIACEFIEPQSRFRNENIRRTIVFFGSARIAAKEEIVAEIDAINREIASQPDRETELQKQLKTAEHRLLMSNYYEEAADTAELLTEWSLTIPPED